MPGSAPEERGVWAGAANNRCVIAAAPIGAAGLVWLNGHPAWFLFPAAALLLNFSHVRVIIGPTGGTVRLGMLGWPRRHIPLDQIVAARAIPVSPLAYGGWGWRRRLGRTAVVIRGGEGLELQLANGRLFVVTVDGAAQAAGRINDLRSRPRPAANAG